MKTNPMKKVRIEKITLNVGAGKDEDKLKRGVMLLKKITGVDPVQTITNKRIPGWALRPGLAIGCKITLRGKPARDLLKRLLEARGNKLTVRHFDSHGNFSFGIHEYVDVPGLDYDPTIKIMGFEVAITLGRPGFHITRRKVAQRRIPKRNHIKVGEAAEFLQAEFGTQVEEAAS